MPIFGILNANISKTNAKNVLWNFLKVKRQVFHDQTTHAKILQWKTPMRYGAGGSGLVKQPLYVMR